MFGATWILVSDGVVQAVAESQRTVTRLQTVKGWLFVGLSGVLIFALARVHRRQLESSRRQLETALQQLQVFYRLFRHDVRNNMNVVRGYIDLARDRVAEERGQSAVAADLRRASDAAEEVVAAGDKLTVAVSACADPTADARIDLVDVVAAECDRVRAEHPAVTVATALPDRARVEADESIRHAVRELLANAVEHHDEPPADRRVAVSIERDRETVAVTVADDGPGIPEAELAALRAAKETQLTHMSGVGLWLVDWIAESFGGEVTFETGAGGTRVTVRLPRAPRRRSLLDAVRRHAGT